MSNLLQYVEPRRFIDAEMKYCKDTNTEYLLPNNYDFYQGSLGIHSYEKVQASYLENKPSFGRALAAWYLRSVGFSFAAIGDLFDISASRASGIIKSIRNKVHSDNWSKNQWNDSVIRLIEKQLFPAFSVGVQDAHRMIQTYSQMRDVESLMYRHSTSQFALNSGVLRIGRAVFDKQREQVGAYRCVCSHCKLIRFPEHIETLEAVD